MDTGKELHVKKGVWFPIHDGSYIGVLNLRVWQKDPVKPVGQLQVFGATQTCQDWQLQLAAIKHKYS